MLDDVDERRAAYAVFNNPFLLVCTPSTLLIHWAPRSLVILWSSWIAHFLLLTSCLFPGPTCAFTATMDILLLTCPTHIPNSWSLPGRLSGAPGRFAYTLLDFGQAYVHLHPPSHMPQSTNLPSPHTPPALSQHDP